MKLFRVRLFKYLKKGMLFLFLIPIVYLGVQVYFAFQNNYITQIAVEHELSESISTVGIAVRDERLIEKNTSGVLRYIPLEGERVSSGSPIAYVFSDIETAQKNVLLDREIAELIILSESVDSPENITNDVSNLAKQQTDSYYDLLDAIHTGEYSGIHEPTDELLLSYINMQIAMDVPYSVQSALAETERIVAELEMQSTPSDVINSPDVGYFFRYTDGGELLYNSEVAESWTAQELTETISLASGLSINDNLVGKIVLDYRWDYYCVIPSVESGRLTVGRDYEISFSDTGSDPLPVELVRMDEPDDNGQVLLQFSCETLNPDVATLRATNAEIIIRSFEGIRVSRDALRIIDGEKGVYIQFGNLIQFKKIAPLFENEEYMILPFESDEENQVKLYDVIVVEGRDLYDGKFL